MPESHYCNFLLVRHSPFEFVLDFGIISPDDPKRAGISSGIVVSPQIAKAILKVIADNIHQYEERHGKLQWPPEGPGADEILKKFGL